MPRFDDRTVLVTGASSGIGEAASARFAAEGARVIAVGRNSARLEDASKRWADPERHLLCPADASSEEAMDDLTARLRSQGIPLDAAVLCAGAHGLRPLQMVKSTHLDEMIGANVKATLFASKLFARCVAPTGGALVWFASAAALVGSPGETLYAASKGALISACRSYAMEVASKKVRVNVVAPGVVETQMSSAWLSRLTPDQITAVRGRHLLGFGSADDLAGVVAFLASDDARWITGTCIVVDGGFTCH